MNIISKILKKSRSINIIYFLLFIAVIPLTSCKTITVEEFKNMYETTEVTGEYVDFSTYAIFEFKYMDSVYKVTFSSYGGIEKGEKYKILIDKKAPDKHYKVLLHKPILMDSISFATIKGRLSNYSMSEGKAFIFIYIKYYDNMYFSARKDVIYIDPKYYKKIKKYKGKDVYIDLFIREYLPNNRAKFEGFINFKCTEDYYK